MTGEFLDRHFLGYQQRWLDDRALFKIGLWARQTGKDYTCAAEAAHDCAIHPNRHWLIVACGERQARETLRKAGDWVRLFRQEESATQKDQCYSPVTRESATEIQFSNGSRISALPARPGTIRGYSANIILTEFAFHDRPEEIWQAIFPSVSNQLRGGSKKVRIISTPNGQGNFFHKFWNESATFSKHKVTIHDACADHLPLNVEVLKQGILDPDSWAQEYECQFLDPASVLLPYELIESCQSADATEFSSIDTLSTHTGELFLGIDFGRKHDLTVCWTLERVPAAASPAPVPTASPTFITREVLVLQRTPTPEQLEHLRPRIQRARRVCFDRTGAGIGLGDSLVQEFTQAGDGSDPSGKIELCNFTAGLKEEIFVKLRAAFERRKIWIPSSREIREDLHGIHRITSSQGHISYRATHSADGHSDRCTALALALRAAESMRPSACASIVGRRFPHLRR